jgi:D-alanyl-lipoteichoic acid acyltransferase DltB (MBOAT superfamily)
MAGYFFYAYSDWHNVAILLGVTLSTFLFGRAIGATRKYLIFIVAIIITISPLLLWKIGQLSESLSNRDVAGFIIPIGLSFYTLQAIGYLLDVFRQRVKPESRLSSIALYLAFFPIMLAGPIERAARLLPQLDSMSRTRQIEVYFAIKQLLWGFFCKLVIADKLALISSDIFGRTEQSSAAILLIGLLMYSFQIYFDFYGYSTIAIATARLFGVQVMENFKHPFLASSLVEFWHRWHISLSTWFRDYVYLPIAYKFKPIYSFTLVVLMVFVLIGLWHGTSPNFVIWGGVHGVLYIVGRLTVRFRRRLWRSVLHGNFQQLLRGIQAVFVFVLVSLTWVFFAVPGLKDAIAVLRRVFSGDLLSTLGSIGGVFMRFDYVSYVACAIIIFIIDSLGIIRAVIETVPVNKTEITKELVVINSFAILMLLTGDIGSRGFIYLRF